ncbi:MAG: DUF3467 domain-containing protein [Flavobacteriales bacterium]|jgi:hypothetical protein|nr:DUF3467 domain-containing protein [Flavobacteriales bacterium]
MSDNKNENNISIELTEETANGQYSNLAIINHSPSEFVLDFVNMMPNVPKAKVQSRMIMAPIHAKRLLAALQQNVQNYEQAFGVIEDKVPAGSGVPNTMNMPYMGTKGEA